MPVVDDDGTPITIEYPTSNFSVLANRNLIHEMFADYTPRQVAEETEEEPLTPEQEEYLRYLYWEKQQEEQEQWEKEHSTSSYKEQE